MGIIYKATNKLNSKIYIGQSKNPLKKRIGQHFAEARTFVHGGRFKKALRKYGENGFDFSGENNPMYGKVGAMKGKKHSEESKQKMREAAIKRNRDRKGKFI